jgi:hypothetical protein
MSPPAHQAHRIAAASCGRSATRSCARPARATFSLRTWTRRSTTRYAEALALHHASAPADGRQALHDTFIAFGNVLSCKVATDDHGNSRGYGFVHYETNEAADTAIKAVNGMLLNDKKVYVGHHVSKKVGLACVLT